MGNTLIKNETINQCDFQKTQRTPYKIINPLYNFINPLYNNKFYYDVEACQYIDTNSLKLD